MNSINKTQLAQASPLILGIHTALSMIIASIFVKYSIKIEKTIGTKATLILAIILLSFMIAIMGISESYLVMILLILRGLPNAASSPIIRAGTTHKLSPSLRATYYSTKSLLGRIAFSITLLTFSIVPGNSFRNLIIVGASLGLFAIIVLLILPIN